MGAQRKISGSEPLFVIRRGRDVPLSGAPEASVAAEPVSGPVAVQPLWVRGMKPRPMVAVGDRIRRGAPLVYDKRDPDFRLCSPVAGWVRSIDFGPRRILQRVVVEPDGADEVEPFAKATAGELERMPGDEILGRLRSSGMLSLIVERPFSRMPRRDSKPKSIFVNAMATAPFQADPLLIASQETDAIATGLAALRRLTAGPVYLCAGSGRDLPQRIAGAGGVTLARFSGPHPSGNSGVHIHHLDPIRPGEHVWTVRLADLALIGKFLLEGAMPGWRLVALGGPGVAEGRACHYRVPWGVALSAWLPARLAAGEMRVVAGDALSGTAVAPDGFLPPWASSVTVLPEDRERHLLAWANPLDGRFSFSQTFVSAWRRGGAWPLGTSLQGAPRAMVATGLYDRYLPMRIRLDFLIRAVLARDWEEAIQLGILELEPEDVALAAFACPSKMDLVGIIREGLAMAEAEGL